MSCIPPKRPTCPRCRSKNMLEIQPCHFQCSVCGGVLDCADNAGSNNEI